MWSIVCAVDSLKLRRVKSRFCVLRLVFLAVAPVSGILQLILRFGESTLRQLGRHRVILSHVHGSSRSGRCGVLGLVVLR